MSDAAPILKVVRTAAVHSERHGLQIRGLPVVLGLNRTHAGALARIPAPTPSCVHLPMFRTETISGDGATEKLHGFHYEIVEAEIGD